MSEITAHTGLSYLKNRWPRYLAGSVAVFISCASEMAFPLVLGWALDALATRHPITPWQAGTLGLALIARLIGLWTSRILLGQEAVSALLWLRRWALESHLKDTAKGIAELTPGQLVHRGFSEARSASFLFGPAWLQGGHLVFTLLLSTGCLFYLSPLTALACLVGWPFLAMGLRRRSRLEGSLREIVQDRQKDLTEFLVSVLKSLKARRLSGAEKFTLVQYARTSSRYGDAAWDARKNGVRMEGIALAFSVVISSLMLIVLVGRVWSGVMTVGGLFAVLAYLVFGSGAVAQWGGFQSAVSRSLISLKRLVLSNASGNRVDDNQSSRAGAPVYRVQNLKLLAETEDRGRASFEILEGEHVSLRDEAGLGAALFRVLTSPDSSYEGSAQFRGTEIRELSQSDRTKDVLFVPRHPSHFSGSIRDNLSLGKTLSEARVWECLKIVDLDHEVAEFPRGLDTRIGENGIGLSTGQRQRLGLARAVARQASVYLLDDSLSGVDVQKGRLIVRRLRNLWKDHTVVLIGQNDWFLETSPRSLRLSEVL